MNVMRANRQAIFVRTLAATLILSTVAAWIFIPRLIESAYQGASLDFLNAMISGQSARSLNEYLRVAQRMLVLLTALIAVAVTGLFAFTSQRYPVWLHGTVICRLVPSALILCYLVLLALALAASHSGIWSYGYSNHFLGAVGSLLAGALAFLIIYRFSALQRNSSQRTIIAEQHEGDYGITKERAALALVGMMLFVFIYRLVSYGEAYERDLMVYITIADRLLDGIPLYSTLWDHKPPAIHLTYAAFVALFGATPLAIFSLGYAAFALTLVGCYEIGKSLGGRLTGTLSALTWSLISGDVFLQANQPNVEVFINLCWVWGIVLLLRSSPEKVEWPRFFLIGLLFFMSTLYKTVAFVVPVFIIATYLIASVAKEDAQQPFRYCLRCRLINSFTAGSVAGAAWIVVFLVFWLMGSEVEFQEAVFDYNRSYAGNIVVNLFRSLDPRIHPYAGIPYIPLLIISISFAIYSSLIKKRSHGFLFLAYFIGAWIALALPGKFFPHYYQLILPPVAIGVGWFGGRIWSDASLGTLRMSFIALFVLPLTMLLYQMAIPVKQLPIAKYGEHGYQSLETKQMANWINEHFNADSAIYHWGAEPGVYFWAHRKSPIGFVYNYPLTRDSLISGRYTDHALADLKRVKPDLVVANVSQFSKVNHKIEKWLQENYVEIQGPNGIEHFQFLVPNTAAEITPGLLE
jgi:hypothetical protein